MQNNYIPISPTNVALIILNKNKDYMSAGFYKQFERFQNIVLTAGNGKDFDFPILGEVIASNHDLLTILKLHSIKSIIYVGASINEEVETNVRISSTMGFWTYYLVDKDCDHRISQRYGRPITEAELLQRLDTIEKALENSVV